MVEAQAGQAPVSPEAQTEAPNPGFIGRIGNTVHAAYESWQQHREQRRVVGQVALAISGGAVAAEAANLVLDAVPAGANDNVPTLSAEAFSTDPATPWAIETHPYEGPGSATASSVSQECKTAALAFPTVVGKIPNTKYYGTIVSRAGLKGQAVGAELKTDGMPEACWSSSIKYGDATIWLSGKKHPQSLSKMYSLGDLHYGGNQAYTNHVVARDQVGTTKDNCKPGGSFWLRFDSKLEDKRHHVKAEKIGYHRIPIYTGHGTKPNC